MDWGRGYSIIMLPPNDQDSFVCTCSILVAFPCPSNFQKFTSTPPPPYSNQLHKYHKKCSPIHIRMFLMPPYTYGINYLAFDLVNYT